MLKLHWIEENDPAGAFPPVARALKTPNGLLAAGGDLSVERLLAAYSRGIFPWFSEGDPLLWWSPGPRMLFEPGRVHASGSLIRHLKRTDARITLDTAFADVVDGCAAPRYDSDGGFDETEDLGTWITAEMRRAYLALHDAGYAHSVEVWADDALVGGLYGVAIGGAFFGESMFSSATNASKTALCWLALQLHRWGYTVFDAQVESEHLARMGAHAVPRHTFLARLELAVAKPTQPGPWQLELERPAVIEHYRALRSGSV